MVCTFHWRTNIGYLGTVIKVMAVHGHYMTMKMQLKREDYNEWWDKIHAMIQEHDVNFLVGDFNMSLTQVVPQLRKRGLQIDTISWYPWLHLEENCLGMDSMAIFYIGGDMISKMPWNIDNIGELLKAASAVPRPQLRQSGEGRTRLDTYTGKNFPGQMWHSYRGPAWKNTGPPQKLEEKLTDLLTPSTGQARLQHLRAHRTDPFLPFCFRTLQKTLDLREWLVGPKEEMHKGAHFPQVMFTDNSCGRSKEAFERRRQSHQIHKAWWAKGATRPWQRGSELTGKTAVAASGKGGKDGRRNEGGKGGKGQTAVAAGEFVCVSAPSSSSPAWLEYRQLQEAMDANRPWELSDITPWQSGTSDEQRQPLHQPPQSQWGWNGSHGDWEGDPNAEWSWEGHHWKQSHSDRDWPAHHW